MYTVGAESTSPPLPRAITFELNNSCNHSCCFCANPVMARRRGVMSPALVYRLLDEAYEAGIAEVAFYATGEPLLCKDLPAYVRHAVRTGYRYVYLSTNGGRAATARLLPVLDAGLHSLKFSINAGTRERYADVHGVDDFDQALANLKRASEYRQQTDRPLRLAVSYVDMGQDAAEDFERLRECVAPLVDEVLRYPFAVLGTPLIRRPNRVGLTRPFVDYQTTDLLEPLNESRIKLPCHQLWNALNVRVEGVLSACCADFDGDLIVADVNQSPLVDAWHSAEFRKFRERHLNHDVAGTLCDSCIAQSARPYAPLNPHLKAGPAGH